MTVTDNLEHKNKELKIHAPENIFEAARYATAFYARRAVRRGISIAAGVAAVAGGFYLAHKVIGKRG